MARPFEICRRQRHGGLYGPERPPHASPWEKTRSEIKLGSIQRDILFHVRSNGYADCRPRMSEGSPTLWM